MDPCAGNDHLGKNLDRHLALHLGARMVFVWVLVCAAVYLAQRPIAAATVPYFEWTIGLLQEDFSASLRIVEHEGHPAIEMRPYLLRPVPLTEQLALRPFITLPPTVVNVDHALVPMVLLLTGVAGWPWARRREAIVRVLLAFAVLPLILAIGTPVLLAGRQQIAFIEAALRHGAKFQEPSLVTFMIFMESGGGWLLPLTAAAVCVLAARLRWPQSPGDPPIRGAAGTAGANHLAFPPI
jgi:hypothetical protein